MNMVAYGIQRKDDFNIKFEYTQTDSLVVQAF